MQKAQMQFNAVTFCVAEDQYYIAYRGTTATTIGWKENFNITLLVLIIEKSKIYFQENFILVGIQRAKI